MSRYLLDGHLSRCAPNRTEELLFRAIKLWPKVAGLCKVVPYDPNQNGAFYMAKLAAKVNFDWIQGNLEKLTYNGPVDIYSALQNSSYVPEHAKGSLSLVTLTVAKYGPASSGAGGPVQSIAPKQSISSKQAAPAKPSTSKQIPAGPTVPELAYVWLKHLAKTGPSPSAKPTPKEYEQLKFLRSKLGAAAPALIEYTIHHWKDFGEQVVATGYPAAPSLPNIGFLCKNYQIALDLAFKGACQKKVKSPGDWKLVDLYPQLQEQSCVV